MADALMFKVFREHPLSGALVRCDAARVAEWQSRKWVLLIDERDVIRADLDDVRREDEERGRRG